MKLDKLIKSVFETFAMYPPLTEPNFQDKKIIIIEGADGVGKTTLAKVFSTLYKLPIIHLTFFDDQEELDGQFDIVLKMLDGVAKNQFGGLIFDRFVESNVVYSEVFKDTHETKYKDVIRDRLKYLLNNGADVTYIACKFENKQDFLDKFDELSQNREELYANKLKEMSLVYDKFEEIWKKLPNIYNDKLTIINYAIPHENNLFEMKEIVPLSKKLIKIF